MSLMHVEVAACQTAYAVVEMVAGSGIPHAGV